MKKLFIPIIIFSSIGANVFAQGKTNNEINNTGIASVEKSEKELKGDKYYFVYSFDKAIDAYKSEEKISLDGQRKLAKSYTNMNQNTEAEEAYKKLIATSGGNLSEDYFNYAMALKANGKYDQAFVAMDQFSSLKPMDLRAKDYIENKGKLSNLLLDNGKYKIEHMNVNTDAQDFSPVYYKNKIVFTSSRSSKLMPKKSNRNDKPFFNMYVSELDQNQLKKPENFDKSLNGKMNDGPASFNKEGTFMAFTLNNYDLKKKELVVNLEIYFRSFADEKWSEPTPFVLNNKAYSVGQPCLSADGNNMYFSSDMPGGFGGVDIYKIKKEQNGTWGQPENLGDKINTEADEMFPFYEENSGVLFFASNGRFGLGGLDIFICQMKGANSGKVYNAGAPLNTKFDDFAVIADDKMSKGYFSSNRSGGSGDDDIYAVDLLDLEIGKKITGFAKDKNGVPVSRSFITLRNEKGDVLDTVTTKDDAAFTFMVESNKKFELIGKKAKYIDGDSITNTFGMERIVKADVILLTKEEVIAQKIQVGSDLAKIVEFNPIYFDLDKYNIRPDAEVELKKIIKVMNDYPAMVVELGAHTDCRETKYYNQILSNKRAKGSVDYIKKRISKPERITGKGYGKEKLVNNCSCDGEIVSTCSEDEHQKNRRTEFIIIKK